MQQHLEKTLEGYRRFLAGLEEVVRDAPPGDARVMVRIARLLASPPHP